MVHIGHACLDSHIGKHLTHFDAFEKGLVVWIYNSKCKCGNIPVTNSSPRPWGTQPQLPPGPRHHPREHRARAGAPPSSTWTPAHRKGEALNPIITRVTWDQGMSPGHRNTGHQPFSHCTSSLTPSIKNHLWKNIVNQWGSAVKRKINCIWGDAFYQ